MKSLVIDEDTHKRLFRLKLEMRAKNVREVINRLITVYEQEEKENVG